MVGVRSVHSIARAQNPLLGARRRGRGVRDLSGNQPPFDRLPEEGCEQYTTPADRPACFAVLHPVNAESIIDRLVTQKVIRFGE